jgi:putative nucleotidyltransferase with HDIG domain
VNTRFRTNAFFICFIPFVALLGLSFLMIRGLVDSAVRAEVHSSLTEKQLAIVRILAKSDLQNNRFLKVAGENPALEAGVELLQSHSGDAGARRTVEDQLRELGEHMGFDLMMVSGPDETPLAAVVRTPAQRGSSELAPIDPAHLAHGSGGLFPLGKRIFQVASVPVNQDEENIGSLSVGEFFDFSALTTPAVLMHNGTVVGSNLMRFPLSELNHALAGCGAAPECDVRLRGALWISLPVHSYGAGYLLRSLQNVDSATAPLQSRLNRLFLTLALISVLMALVASIAASRSIEKPIATLVSNLRKASRTGELPEFHANPSTILEIRELAENYNRAAVSVREAGERLQSAYLEFTGSLASALDARDPYTAGHSWRVSQLSFAAAEALRLPAADRERIRIGALLHDIGKIGIADAVLQKPGRLTREEFEIVTQHPVIGRRILEGVRGFTPFLTAVELHHENWDGSGYPYGQSGEQTPVDARIIHVADAYDAMTSDRSYRLGLRHEEAIQEILDFAGVQFDPLIAEVFAGLPGNIFAQHSAAAARAARPALAAAG